MDTPSKTSLCLQNPELSITYMTMSESILTRMITISSMISFKFFINIDLANVLLLFWNVTDCKEKEKMF